MNKYVQKITCIAVHSCWENGRAYVSINYLDFCSDSIIVETSEEADGDAQTMMMKLDEKSLLRWSKWESRWDERADAKQLMREAEWNLQLRKTSWEEPFQKRQCNFPTWEIRLNLA